MITLPYNLDICPNFQRNIVARLSQGDEDFEIVISLYATNGTLTIEDGTTAQICGTLTDGTGYTEDATLNISNGTVTISGDADLTACAGANVFEIVLTKGTKVLHSQNFEIWVEPAA